MWTLLFLNKVVHLHTHDVSTSFGHLNLVHVHIIKTFSTSPFSGGLRGCSGQTTRLSPLSFRVRSPVRFISMWTLLFLNKVVHLHTHDVSTTFLYHSYYRLIPSQASIAHFTDLMQVCHQVTSSFLILSSCIKCLKIRLDATSYLQLLR